MRLVLSQYLRTLRERDEFDRLLPELLSEMGYVSLVKPQAGTRQFGVDFPAAGKSVKDGADELLLFVIKQGDIGRHEWSGGQNAVRQSMEEILDVFLASQVPSGYENHRKVIVVATTGDLSQDTLPNWSGFTDRHTQVAFEFWGADHVARLLEQYLLDENLFDTQDRSDLRKSLALAGDSEYRFTDLCPAAAAPTWPKRRRIAHSAGAGAVAQGFGQGAASSTSRGENLRLLGGRGR